MAVDVSHEPGPVERLYRQHVPKNIRIAYLLMGDAEVARDLVHDAFLKTSGRLHTLRSTDTFGAYMTRTVVNMSKRHRERRARERRFVDRESGRPPRHALQPDIATRDELLTALRELPHRQRAAIVLRFYSDLSEAETAELLGCAVGTVKSMVSRGLASLRQRIGDE